MRLLPEQMLPHSDFGAVGWPAAHTSPVGLLSTRVVGTYFSTVRIIRKSAMVYNRSGDETVFALLMIALSLIILAAILRATGDELE